MTILYPIFLWFLIPLFLLLKRESSIVFKSHIVILIAIVSALSRPVIDNGAIEESIESKNIIIALDASYSMMATDIEPNRYEFAKETIEFFLKNNPKTTITLIAFTQNPLLLSPPTTDHQLIMVALKTLNPKYILTKGTSLTNLFKRVSTLKTPHKNLLLISDGGEELNLAEIREQLNDNSINLSILGVGTVKGTTIKKDDGEIVKDKNGDLVITSLNPILKELTRRYIETSSTPKETAEGLEKILDIDNRERLKKLQHNYKELYQYPLFFALILFFTLHTKFIKYLFIILSLFGISAQASILDNYYLSKGYNSYKNREYKKAQIQLEKIEIKSLESVTTLANSNYQLGEYKEAIKLYKSISSTSIDVKRSLYYNIANCYAKLKEYANAREYYVKVLQLGVDDDALYNLKLIIFKDEKKELISAISKPKSEANKGGEDKKDSKEKRSKKGDSSTSGSSTSGVDSQKKLKKKEEKEKSLLESKEDKNQNPISSKAYQLINKGYIYETKPW